jgi:hypothetical protein
VAESVLSSLFDGGVNGEEQVSGEVLPVVQVRQVLNKLLHMPNIGLIFCIYYYLGLYTPHRGCTVTSSVADLGCLSRIPDPKTATKDRGEKFFFVKPFFVGTNFTKLNIILFLIC